MSKNPSGTKWYNTDWFMWVSLVFFAPLGICLLWKKGKFSKNARLIVSGVAGVFFVVMCVNAAINPPQTTAPTQADNPPPVVATQPQAEAPKPEPVDPEVAKANAKDADNQMWQIVLSIEGTNKKLADAINAGDDLAAYDEAKNAKEYQRKFWGQASDVKCEGIDAYREAVQLYSSVSGDLPSNLIKYMDKKEMKYLSNYKESAGQLETYATQVAAARLQFLTDSGLPQEQIEKILAGEE